MLIILSNSHFAEKTAQEVGGAHTAGKGRGPELAEVLASTLQPFTARGTNIQNSHQRAAFCGIARNLSHMSGWGKEDEKIQGFIQIHAETFPSVQVTRS